MEKQVKGFRNQKTKEEVHHDIKESLSVEEAHYVQELRKYDYLDKDSKAYQLALNQDALRVNIRTWKEEVEKRLWNIKDIRNKINRSLDQLKSGEIYETIGETKIVMNKYELQTYIEHMRWVQRGEVRAIPKTLLQIRGCVGHIDITRNVVMEEKDYESYVTEIENKVIELGFNIYD
jgi:hypothetical protein